MPKKEYPQLPPPPGWLLTTDAADYLGLESSTIRNLIRSGALDPGLVGRTLYVSKASVDRYARERKNPGYPSGKPRPKKDDEGKHKR